MGSEYRKILRYRGFIKKSEDSDEPDDSDEEPDDSDDSGNASE